MDDDFPETDWEWKNRAPTAPSPDGDRVMGGWWFANVSWCWWRQLASCERFLDVFVYYEIYLAENQFKQFMNESGWTKNLANLD